MTKPNGHELKIEKGIPIPPKKDKRTSSLAAVFRSLEIGDSFLLPNSPATANKYAHLYLGAGNYTTRATPDGVRVWRTK